MKRSSLLKTILYIVSITLVLLVLIIAVAFLVVGNGVYGRIKADELMPKAESIANYICESVYSGVSRKELEKEIRLKGLEIPEATLCVVFSDEHNVWDLSDVQPYDETKPIMFEYFLRVIKGETMKVSNTEIGVFVGVPAIPAGRDKPIAAVFMMMHSLNVQHLLKSVAVEFGLALLAVMGIMIVPIYILFKKVTTPIQHVSDTALAMAAGDLSVRAKEEGSYEARHLAQSFNILAGALQSTIDDLTIERNRLRALLDGLGEGIISVDKVGGITHFNSSSIQLLGGGDDDELELMLAYERIRTHLMDSIANDLKESVDINIGERLIRCTTTPIHDENGSLYGAVTLLRDITESERLEQTRRDYVANVSHELRTPLASIRSLADALNDGLITSAQDRSRYYGYILRESMRLSQLIDDLLELSRLQSGGIAFTKKRIELYELTYDVADRMSDTARKYGKSIVLNVPEGKYFAFSNADRIEQVVVALVDNAIRHGNDGCTINIKFELNPQENRYYFRVCNPANMEQSDLDHLFERFYKVDRSHSGDGTGLGLAIVNEVLGLLGEKITVSYSDGIICFCFTISCESEA